jgi:hypothetical protein
MTDTRPSPPPLEYETPPCSICCADTELEDGTFNCRQCECSWPVDSTDNGTWWCVTNGEPKAQCEDTIQPFLKLDPKIFPEIWKNRYRCYLDAGHEGGHMHPHYIGSWPNKEEST